MALNINLSALNPLNWFKSLVGAVIAVVILLILIIIVIIKVSEGLAPARSSTRLLGIIPQPISSA